MQGDAGASAEAEQQPDGARETSPPTKQVVRLARRKGMTIAEAREVLERSSSGSVLEEDVGTSATRRERHPSHTHDSPH